MKTSLSRRSLVRGCGALPVLAGLFDRSRRAAAQTPAPTKPPTRFLVFLQLQGQLYPLMRPSGTETSFTLSPVMTGLDPWRSKLIVFDKLHNGGALYARKTNSSGHGT